MQDKIYQYMQQEGLRSFEGRRGVQNLCQLVSALGYHDPMRYGQLSSKACLGDLIAFLEDNSGALEAIIDFISNANVPEWEEALDEQLQVDDEEIGESLMAEDDHEVYRDSYEDEWDQGELCSGCYVRDGQGDSEVFKMSGSPEDRRVRIEDRNGRGWYISPSRLSKVDDNDPAIAEYFPDAEDSDDDYSIGDADEFEPMRNESRNLKGRKLEESKQLTDLRRLTKILTERK